MTTESKLVSNREFFDDDYWKKKRYNAVIAQAGRAPADFEFVEMQDLLNYERQQGIGDIVECGFIADGFQVFAPTSGNTIRIKQGRGYVKPENPITSVGDTAEDFRAIRLDLPDYKTNQPTEPTWEHAVTAGYYTKDVSVTSGGVSPGPHNLPSPGNWRYDLVYLEFYRLQYERADDEDMVPDANLGETATREKWHYDIKYLDTLTNVGNKNPTYAFIPGIPANHYIVRLAVIRRQTLSPGWTDKTITQDDIFDVRPRLTVNSNSVGSNTITIGGTNILGVTAVGGKYSSLIDLLGTQTGDVKITPTATSPYTIVLLPGVHTIPALTSDPFLATPPALDFGTMGYIRIVGCGVDKTILEFNNIYAFTAPLIWMNIGASPFIEFADMTIRVNSAFASGTAQMIKISGGTVRFTNCKIGEVATSATTAPYMGGIKVDGGTLTIRGCEISTRSATIAAVEAAGVSTVKIYDSTIKQSLSRALLNGSSATMKVCDSEIYCNYITMDAQGLVEVRDCSFTKQAWVTGDALVGGNTVYIGVANSRFYSCRFVGISTTPGGNQIEVNETTYFHDCYHDDLLLIDNNAAHTSKFFSCNLNLVSVTNSAKPEFYNCAFAPTSPTNVITLMDTSVTRVQNCSFYLDNASAIGIYANSATITLIASHCTFTGNASAEAFAAATATTIKAGDIDGDVTLKDGNITITDIRLA